MHNFRFPDWLIERLTARRGGVHMYDALDSSSTGLVVIDMQNMFVAPGAPLEIPTAREIVPNINRLAAALRETGGRVYWVQVTARSDTPDDWRPFFEHVLAPEEREVVRPGLTPGNPLHDNWSELDIRAGDEAVLKYRFSAMIQGASDLDARLARDGIDTLLIAGTLTNICCESTGRDAMMLGYRTVMISDANATRSDYEHEASLVTYANSFGDVRTTDEAIELLKINRPAVAAAGE
jgi:ureidoacrylate peracid hydrolase